MCSDCQTFFGLLVLTCACHTIEDQRENNTATRSLTTTRLLLHRNPEGDHKQRIELRFLIGARGPYFSNQAALADVTAALGTRVSHCSPFSHTHTYCWLMVAGMT